MRSSPAAGNSKEHGRKEAHEFKEDNTNNSEQEPLSPPSQNPNNSNDIFRDEPEGDGEEDVDDDDDDSYEEREMTLQELMYSSSSFYAIVVPGKIRLLLYYILYKH